MATTTANVDDLVAGLSGKMHVSQDGYDLQALQEYLNQHLPIPFPSPSAYPLPLNSRSTSTTRKPSSLPSYTYPSPTPSALSLPPTDPYSPPPTTFSTSFPDPAPQFSHHPTNRPAPPRRASSFGTTPHSYTPAQSSGYDLPAPASPQASYAAFESDAFAPALQQQQQHREEVDPWAKMRSAPAGAFGAFGGGAFGQQGQAQPSQGFGQYGQGFGQGYGQDQGHQWGSRSRFAQGMQRPPTPPDEEVRMVGASMDQDMDMDDDEEVDDMISADEDEGTLDVWGRGRRKW
ncbi:hypothetical protein IAT38_004344 [Cryptococcus sp. DSM 104549]